MTRAAAPEAGKAAGRTAGPEATLRRRLAVLGAIAAVLAVVHHVDHVVRGELVFSRHLEPAWNHSGWPFQPEVTAFTPTLLIEPFLFVGVWLTLRRRVWAGFWLATAVLLGAVVVWVHLVPEADAETPSVIFNTYPSPLLGAVAVGVVVAIVAALATTAVAAVQARLRTGRW